MQLDIIFSYEAQLITGGMFLLSALLISSIISGEDSYACTVFITGMSLIALSVFAIIYIENIDLMAKGWVDEKRLSQSVYDDYIQKSNLFLFVFPFVTAAIGTNLLSDVITRNITYKKELTFKIFFGGMFDLIKAIFSFALSIILIPLIAIIYIIALISSLSSATRKYIPTLVRALGILNRKAQLLILKLDIISRHNEKEH
ncbi:hypothetical protein [Enterovibrio norvegicus]|uniref:hypothetical protein n=1 Tax=Enterovibrio norvegicus TaxID=188144 RepID=UPI0003662535|nr:hypothetical protein [Enterovibrio norvegicus]OEF57947.1 hypothetical protein A1OU_07000 [Enterovibrio norvegicus]